jgi:hypothetical protein
MRKTHAWMGFFSYVEISCNLSPQGTVARTNLALCLGCMFMWHNFGFIWFLKFSLSTSGLCVLFRLKSEQFWLIFVNASKIHVVCSVIVRVMASVLVLYKMFPVKKSSHMDIITLAKRKSWCVAFEGLTNCSLSTMSLLPSWIFF